MRILLLKSNVKDSGTLSKGLALVKQQALSIGLDLEFTIGETARKFTSLPYADGYQVSPNEIYLEEQSRGTYDVVVLIYDWNTITPKPTHPTDNAYYIQIPEQYYNGSIEAFSIFFFHELSHETAWKYGKKDLTHLMNDMTLDPVLYQQWSQKPLTDFFLYLIKTNSNNMTYKYFKDKEIIGLKPELVNKLDIARGIAGVPFTITSGFRTVAQNKEVGGVDGSAHTTGEAVDLSIKDSTTRYRVILGLIGAGFNRIEDCKSHIHVDISKTAPQNVFIWSNDD